MKKSLKGLFVLVSCGAMLLGCPGNREENIPSPPPPPDPSYITLDTPTLTLDKENGTVSWTAVENAQYYRYYINNGDLITTTNTSVSLKDGENIAVMADSDDQYTLASNWSTPITNVNIDETYKYATITFFDAGEMNSITHPKGSALHINGTPVKGQYAFDGWYKDPFFEDLFVDGEIVNSDLKLFAKWNAPSFMNANFFVKCNNHISNKEKGYKDENPTESSWGFIPLHYDSKASADLGNRKAFSAIVTTDSSCTTDDPGRYLIMDGIDDLNGRKYWKSADDENFTIKSQGTWKIVFSIEYEWDKNGQKVHAHLDSYTEQTYSLNKITKLSNDDLIATPNITLNKEESKVTWDAVEGATKYRYSINGGAIQETNSNEINLYQGQYIIVQAVGDSTSLSSKWSSPIVYNYEKPIENDFNYVTFFNSEVQSLKVNKGSTICNPGTPTKLGYTFDGWYADINYKTPFDFSKEISKNTVIYAKWNEVTDVNRYHLLSPKGIKVTELHLNNAQTSFNEYFATFNVKSGEEGTWTIVDSLDNNKILYTHEISDSPAEYQVCFSFDHTYSTKKFAAINHTRYSLYFTNNLDSNNEPSAHYWNVNISSRGTAWPGTKMSYEKTNKYGQAVYSISIYKDYYTHIIFNNSNNGLQTINISLEGATNGKQWWCTDEKDSEGHYKVGSGTFGD